MAGSTQYSSTNESCQARIPLFPLRYSAHPRPKGGADYAYDEPTLAKGFKKLDHAQYGLRCVGGGFIYLFDETEGKVYVWRVNEENGQFIELLSKHRSLEAAIEGYRPGKSVPHIWAKECSVVHILLTDTLLTERKIRDIESDRDGVRTKLATTIDIKTWQTNTPSNHTFAAESLGKVVEEFKGTDLAFSPWRGKLAVFNFQALVTGMKAVAPAKQIAVVMYDNIALVQDLGGIFNKSRHVMEAYNSAPDKTSNNKPDIQRCRKMLIAKLVGNIYASVYASKAGVADKGEEAFERALKRDMDEREWKRKRFADNLAVIEREPAKYRPSSYPSARKQLDALPSDPIGQRAAALSEAAPLYSRHVREADRVSFMRDFTKELVKRHCVVVDRKNDRYKWLESYLSTASPIDMGATFLRYDTKEPMSSTSHAIAFSACIEGMVWGTETMPSGKKDSERELFNRWWKLPWNTNPILVNIEHDKGLIDAVWENKMDVAADTALSKVLGQLLRFGALHYLMEQVGVYTLSRFPGPESTGQVWHGAARDAVANRIHQLAGMGTPEDANRLVQMLESRYQDRLTTRQLTRQEAIHALEDAAGFPRGAVTVGSLGMGAGDTMEVIVWQRLTPMTRYANPFLQVFEHGVAGGVAFFSFLNLKAAVLAFDSANVRTTGLNLVAAVMGAGSALNGLLLSTRAIMPTIYLQVSWSGIVIRAMTSTAALRVFGYGGALAESATNWSRASDQRKIGNDDAATAYALAGMALGLGGAAVTTGGAALTYGLGMAGVVATVPVWGWIAAGVILLGVGLWWGIKGEKAQFTPLSYWLNDCSFGNNELLGRTAVTLYPTLDDENKGYVHASYAPRQVEADWHMTSNTLTIKIIYPLVGTIQKVTAIETGESEPQLHNSSGEEKLPSGGVVLTYRVLGLTRGKNFNYSLIPSYIPTLLGEELKSTLVFSDRDTPWYY
ncbi:toxin VasX [Pseudomonas sp. MF4836]|uniref:toxin VasX n=1 Tax=Pseudomonas sp. MF4836 TaxID=1960827 RepID=UPI0009971089|nr:toxin VasX [Pseudomonas sp. MF4836]OOW00819.1 hypothetical protein MF4836_02600 [Pseudomonas sp. MF4836]